MDELLSEFALAHVEGSMTVATYARDDLLEKRRRVMRAWRDFVLPDLLDFVLPDLLVAEACADTCGPVQGMRPRGGSCAPTAREALRDDSMGSMYWYLVFQQRKRHFPANSTPDYHGSPNVLPATREVVSLRSRCE